MDGYENERKIVTRAVGAGYILHVKLLFDIMDSVHDYMHLCNQLMCIHGFFT
jgi:hypothetical protein